MKAAVFSNGELGEISLLKNMLKGVDYIICADGGLKHLKGLGRIPNLILGDFDSVEPELLRYYQQKGVQFEKYPSEKDETDTQIAVNTAVEMGAEQIVITGAIGSRFDHSYANIMLLKLLLNRRVEAVIVHQNNVIRLLKAGTHVLKEKEGTIVSLLPFGGDAVIENMTGFKYTSNEKHFKMDQPIGISNVIMASTATLIIQSGYLLFCSAWD